MARLKTIIQELPEKLRLELHGRLIASGFGDLVATAKWLTGLGYPVSKTAIYEYAKTNRAAIELSVAQHKRKLTAAARSAEEIRLRCLEAAAASGPAATTHMRAEQYAAWVFRGERFVRPKDAPQPPRKRAARRST